MSRNKVFLALCVNAAALLMILFVVLSHDNGPSMTPTATAQTQIVIPNDSPIRTLVHPQKRPAEIMPSDSPIAGGEGLYMMPAQLSPNTWGCYLLDVNNQTMSVYQYNPGEKMLRLNAARNIRYDHQLENFNTAPPPMDVKDLVEHEEEMKRSMVPTGTSTPPVAPSTRPSDTSKEQ